MKVVDEIAEEVVGLALGSSILIDGFIEGYNKSQETHSFTERNMLDFLRYVEDNYYYNSGGWLNSDTDKWCSKIDILKLWKDENKNI